MFCLWIFEAVWASFPPSTQTIWVEFFILSYFLFCLLPTYRSDFSISLLIANPWISSPPFQWQSLLPSAPRHVFQRFQKKSFVIVLNQVLNPTNSCPLKSHLFLCCFLQHHCTLTLSHHLPHLKPRFTRYPHVSLWYFPTPSLIFSAYCWCSTKDQNTEHPLPLGSHTSIISLFAKLPSHLSRLALLCLWGGSRWVGSRWRLLIGIQTQLNC